MEIFKKLESLGFFEWLKEKSFSNGFTAIFSSGFTAIILDAQPFDSIERSGYNAIAFRWFREKYNLQASNIMFSNGKYDTGITRYKGTQSVWGNGPIYDTYEKAELECLVKLIDIVESKSE